MFALCSNFVLSGGLGYECFGWVSGIRFWVGFVGFLGCGPFGFLWAFLAVCLSFFLVRCLLCIYECIYGRLILFNKKFHYLLKKIELR